MSKIGNHRVGLQKNPSYEDGWKSAEMGIPRDYVEEDHPYYADDNAAWQAGWDDYHKQEQSR